MSRRDLIVSTLEVLLSSLLIYTFCVTFFEDVVKVSSLGLLSQFRYGSFLQFFFLFR